MKAKRFIALILTALLLVQCGFFYGCTGSKPLHLPFDMPEGEPVKYWLQWYTLGDHAEELKRPDGTYPSWDWISASEQGINLMYVLFTPLNEDGTAIGGLPDTDSLKKHCDIMQYEIGKTHEAGISLIAFSTDVQFKTPETVKMGCTPEQIAVFRNGEPVVDFNWDPEGTYIACINAPLWRDWCRNNVTVLAEAGFDGLQYDYGPYSAYSGNCECEHCRKSWADYSLKTLGKSLDIPTESPDYSKEEHREYTRWKYLMFADFIKDTLSDAKALNPDFFFLMNESVMSNTFASMCLTGAYDMTSSEYWGVDVGIESSLFMYALNEALGYDCLLGIFNSADQVTPEYRLKVAMAESYAVNGGVSHSFTDTSRTFATFTDAHPELFLGTESKSSTAVLYSAESALFSGTGNDAAVTAGKKLATARIPFDFIVLETEGSLDKMDGYDTFVIPSFSYFSDNWKPYIEKAVKKGKTILVIGDDAADYVKNNAGWFKNKPVYLDNNQNIQNALSGTSAYGLITCDSDYYGVGEPEFTVRHINWKYDIIHAIKTGSPYFASDDNLTADYRISEGCEIESITAYCPYAAGGNYEVAVSWTLKNGVVHIETDDFDTYCIIQIEYKE